MPNRNCVTSTHHVSSQITIPLSKSECKFTNNIEFININNDSDLHKNVNKKEMKELLLLCTKKHSFHFYQQNMPYANNRSPL